MVLANFEQYKSDAFQAFKQLQLFLNLVQLFVFFKTKNKELKSIIISGITGIFGITEPSIYGVNLRFKNHLLLHVLVGLAP